MHIGIDVRSLLDANQTGVGNLVSGMVKSLLEYTDVEVTLYYNAAKTVSFDETAWKQLGANIVRTRYPNKLFTVLSPLLQFPKVDRIIAKQVKPIDLFFSPNIQYVPLSAGTPRVLLIHDLSFVHFPEFFSPKRMLWHKLQRLQKQVTSATAIVVPSDSTKDDVIATFDCQAEAVTVVYPGIDTTYFDKVSDETKQAVRDTYHLPETFVLFLGTIEPRKNIEAMVEAFEMSGLANKSYELIIAGAKGWNDASIHAAIAKTPQVRYIGYVKENEKPALYQLATSFVYPSLYEGFGFPVLEAMAQGTPVITSNRSSLPEITGGKVQLVHPERVHEISEALQRKPEEENSIAYTEIASAYTWEKAARELHSLFETYGR